MPFAQGYSAPFFNERISNGVHINYSHHFECSGVASPQGQRVYEVLMGPFSCVRPYWLKINVVQKRANSFLSGKKKSAVVIVFTTLFSEINLSADHRAKEGTIVRWCHPPKLVGLKPEYCFFSRRAVWLAIQSSKDHLFIFSKINLY